MLSFVSRGILHFDFNEYADDKQAMLDYVRSTQYRGGESWYPNLGREKVTSEELRLSYNCDDLNCISSHFCIVHK